MVGKQPQPAFGQIHREEIEPPATKLRRWWASDRFIFSMGFAPGQPILRDRAAMESMS